MTKLNAADLARISAARRNAWLKRLDDLIARVEDGDAQDDVFESAEVYRDLRNRLAAREGLPGTDDELALCNLPSLPLGSSVAAFARAIKEYRSEFDA